MERHEREQVIERIRQEMKSLSDELKALKGNVNPVEPDRAIGRLTRMEAIQARSVNEAVIRRGEGRLARLQEALERSGDEDFGECTVCELPIPLPRLLAVPEARICVECARERGG